MDKIEYLVGNSRILNNMEKVPVLQVFSKQVVDFFSKLSSRLLKDKKSKEYTDILSYGFWIRKSNLEMEKKEHMHIDRRVGRGVTFHIAPSNVPVNFAVSMTSALLAGNACIIRVSNKEFEQVDIICKHIKQLLESDCKDMQEYICIVRYNHDDKITQALTDKCDIRIIWGGDATINQIRKTQLQPKSIEMTFPDRYSIALIDAKFYLECNYEKVAKDFYTDTYYTDQNACSSPRLVVWFGEEDEISRARDEFWNELYKLVEKNYGMKPIQAVDKYESFCMLAANKDGVHIISDNNYITRVEVEKLDDEIMRYKNGGGYFFEYVGKSIEDIIPILNKECQTIAYLGLDNSKIKDIVYNYGVRGVDRIVPIGKTMELQFIWDGYNMIESMSRVVWSK